jgi:hypothetical protein
LIGSGPVLGVFVSSTSDASGGRWSRHLDPEKRTSVFIRVCAYIEIIVWSEWVFDCNKTESNLLVTWNSGTVYGSGGAFPICGRDITRRG